MSRFQVKQYDAVSAVIIDTTDGNAVATGSPEWAQRIADALNERKAGGDAV